MATWLRVGTAVGAVSEKQETMEQEVFLELRGSTSKGMFKLHVGTTLFATVLVVLSWFTIAKLISHASVWSDPQWITFH